MEHCYLRSENAAHEMPVSDISRHVRALGLGHSVHPAFGRMIFL